MLNYKKYLSELNIEWSRSYSNKQLPASYISQSLSEGEEIYDALIKKCKKENKPITEFKVSELPVSSHIKKKYGNVTIKGTFRLTVGFRTKKAGIGTQLFNPNKLKDQGSILKNDPVVELELISKNAKITDITFAKRRFAHYWVDFKRTLLTNTLYKDMHKSFSMDMLRGAGTALAALSLTLASFVTGFVTAPLGLVIITGIYYGLLEYSNHFYFVNDPIEVEAAAITLINERRGLLKAWSKEHFVETLGPKILSHDEFVSQISNTRSLSGVLTGLSQVSNNLSLTDENRDRFNDILYDAYVATMKGKL